MPISDLTGYTWVGNSSLTNIGDYDTYTLSFKDANNTEYYELDHREDWIAYLGFDGQTIVWDGTWANQAYKTIVITGGTDATNATLIAWLEANGTLTAPEPSISDLTGYTWVGNNSVSITSASVGTYNVNYSITCDSAEYNANDGTALNIVYTSEYDPFNDSSVTIAYITINTSNYSEFGGQMSQGNGRIYESSFGATLPATATKTIYYSSTEVNSIEFTGGTDATNADLIAWLQANGTLTAPAPAATPSLNFGGSDVSLFLGSSYVSKVYLGTTLLYEGEAPTPDNAILTADNTYLVDSTGGYLLTTEI